MNSKAILIVSGEPNSIFLEIFFKVLKNKKIQNPLILITSENLLKLQMKKLKYKKNIRLIKPTDITKYKLDNKSINLVNVKYNSMKAFEKISRKSNLFIKNSFKIAFKILKQNKIKKFINGPISKKSFLNKKFLGLTEYISDSFSKKKNLYVDLQSNSFGLSFDNSLTNKIGDK